MLPLILIGIGIASLFVVTKGFGFWGKDENGEPIKEITLAVLGPSASGKTLLFSFLKTGEIQIQRSNTPLKGEKFEELTIEEGEKKIKLKSTIDAPGAYSSVTAFYDVLIKEANFIFFIFNCNDFLNDDVYRKHTLSMTEFINRNNFKKQPIIFLGSHVDQLLKRKDSKSERETSMKKVIELLNEEIDRTHLNEILLINMHDIKEMNELKKLLFK